MTTHAALRDQQPGVWEPDTSPGAAAEDELAKWKRLSRLHEKKGRRLRRALDQAREQLDTADDEIAALRTRIQRAHDALAATTEGATR